MLSRNATSRADPANIGITAHGIRASLHRYRSGNRRNRRTAQVLLRTLYGLAHQRQEVRFVARHASERACANAAVIPARRAACNSRLGCRIRGDARWWSASTDHSISTCLRRAGPSACDTAEGDARFRRRADGCRRYGHARRRCNAEAGDRAATEMSGVERGKRRLAVLRRADD